MTNYLLVRISWFIKHVKKYFLPFKVLSPWTKDICLIINPHYKHRCAHACAICTHIQLAPMRVSTHWKYAIFKRIRKYFLKLSFDFKRRSFFLNDKKSEEIKFTVQDIKRACLTSERKHFSPVVGVWLSTNHKSYQKDFQHKHRFANACAICTQEPTRPDACLHALEICKLNTHIKKLLKIMFLF